MPLLIDLTGFRKSYRCKVIQGQLSCDHELTPGDLFLSLFLNISPHNCQFFQGAMYVTVP